MRSFRPNKTSAKMHAMNADPRYLFPLTIQLTPEDDLRDARFTRTLETLQKHGFFGVELNVVDFERYPASAYAELLAEYGLTFTMIATGLYARKNSLSLSSPDPAIRQETTARLGRIVRFAADAGAGVICGFIKGPAGMDRKDAEENIRTSLGELDGLIRECKTPLLIEATNHYEASAALSVEGAIGLFRDLGNSFIRVLPDTYHMNIEEANTIHSLLRGQGCYESIHISDNNRFFPGYGGIDFFAILSALAGMRYQGVMAIEGNWHGEPEEDIAFACEYLANATKRIRLLD